MLMLSLDGTFSVGTLAESCGFQWPLPVDFMYMSDAYMMFVAQSGGLL